MKFNRKEVKESLNKLNLKPSKVKNISKGTSNNFRLKVNDAWYLLKIVGDQKENIKSKEQKELEQKYGKPLPVIQREENHKRTTKRIVQLETRVLNNWYEKGLSSPRVKQTDNKKIILMEYINGNNYFDIVKSDQLTSNQKKSLLNILENYRKITRNNNNKLFLHNDLHLGNIMYDEENKKTKFIDPGLVFNPELDYQTLDTHINLVFCYTLLPGYYFQSIKKTNIEILEGFLDTLSKKEKEKMITLNKYVQSEFLTSLESSNMIEEFSWLSTFKKENYELINGVLKK